jgi:hypothetical protein
VLITYYIDTWVYPYTFKYLPSETLALSVPFSAFTVTTTVPTYTGTTKKKSEEMFSYKESAGLKLID